MVINNAAATGTIRLTGTGLTLEDLARVSRERMPAGLARGVANKVRAAEDMVQQLVGEDGAVYGITTGFGRFASVNISPEEHLQLQRNLLRSHAVGLGEPFSPEVVRAAMLLRANSLVRGYSGIRLETLQLLIEMLNRDVVPIVPRKGSVGASGDLAPLAHMALVLIGEGEADYGGQRLPGSRALQEAGLQPITLGPKEGLALINGTQFMAGSGALTAVDTAVLLRTADIVAAMTVEALEGVVEAFHPAIHDLRPHPGQLRSAANARRLLAGSARVTSQAEKRVQDAYTLRCTPQVHGASYNALDHAREVLEIELNAVTDNPLLFPEDARVLSGGNFHGQPIAMILDYLSIALANIAGISERRAERLLNPSISGLPAFLAVNGGLHSGLMVAQYTAAALVSETKVLSHPASVDTIPTSANQEDHVSMGNHSAMKARDILWNATRVLAIEAVCAAQAMDIVAAQDEMAAGTRAAYECIRSLSPFLAEDRPLSGELEAVAQHISSGEMLSAVEAAVGGLE